MEYQVGDWIVVHAGAGFIKEGLSGVIKSLSGHSTYVVELQNGREVLLTKSEVEPYNGDFDDCEEDGASTSYQIGGDHYKGRAIQPIDYILANELDFCEGNVVKYVTRWRFKNGVEDLKKARQYLDFMIEEEESKDD